MADEKKINDELEKLSDDELEKVAGGDNFDLLNMPDKTPNTDPAENQPGIVGMRVTGSHI